MICFIPTSDGTENCVIYEKEPDGAWYCWGTFSKGKSEMIKRAIGDALVNNKSPIVEPPYSLLNPPY